MGDMRLAALYSGGKDSAFALYLAKQMGHEVSCLVSIVPKAGESWIFHVPNTGIVPLMASSMGMELITAETAGSEEDDMRALKDVLSSLDIDGVVTGAVWSDYQWDRMNAVCGDLGLKVIAPLWRKDQDMILDEMMAAGIRAIIVGCYAEGLDGSWLGREIDAPAAEELRRLREKYGISVIGEGGEYESMTIDSPMHNRPLMITECEKEWKKGAGTLFVTKAELGER
jgi:ABC transporter with metal-binding/Fe-S-binding domain ATP-binding protein